MTLPTIKVHFDDSMINKARSADLKPIVRIEEGDMFVYALNEYRKGKSVSLHNFANNNSPGIFRTDAEGGHYFYTNTQEEQLLRSSLINGKIFIPLDFYPICANGINSTLITRDVLFNKDRKNGQQISESEQYRADVITCPAIDLPDLTENGKYLFEIDEETTFNRMVLVLNMAKDNDVFITGLWGCGAFCHPIKEVMRLWKKAIDQSSEFPKEIIFCYYLDVFTNISSEDEKNINIMKQLL